MRRRFQRKHLPPPHEVQPENTRCPLNAKVLQKWVSHGFRSCLSATTKRRHGLAPGEQTADGAGSDKEPPSRTRSHAWCNGAVGGRRTRRPTHHTGCVARLYAGFLLFCYEDTASNAWRDRWGDGGQFCPDIQPRLICGDWRPGIMRPVPEVGWMSAHVGAPDISEGRRISLPDPEDLMFSIRIEANPTDEFMMTKPAQSWPFGSLRGSQPHPR